MLLNAAREVKEEIRAMLPSYALRSGAPVAVGFSPGPDAGDYKVAIRPRRSDDLTNSALRYLDRATGGDVDIRVTGAIRPCRALAMGISTAHVRGAIGTLGFFARRTADGRVGFVSNNHVIAAEDEGVDGDDVVVVENGAGPRVVGKLSGDYPRLRSGSTTVDCAFAQLIDGIDFDATLGGGEILASNPVDAAGHLAVRKVGRSSGRTEGKVSAFALTDVVVDYSFGSVLFHEQIEIESLTTEPFSLPGDSGSLIFTVDRQPLALLHAGSAIGGVTNAGLTYANPLSAVFEALGVTLLT